MFLTCLLALSMHPQSAALNLEWRAQRLPDLVKRLGEETNRNLYVSPELANRVLIVRFKDVAPDLALAKIAETVDGEWVQRDSNTILRISPVKQAALTAKWYEARRKGVEKAIQKLAEPLNHTPEFDLTAARKLENDLAVFDAANEGHEEEGRTYFEQMRAIFARGPGGRAIARILKSCDPDEIARLPYFTKTIFATAPNRLQHAMPRDFASTMATLKTENETWKKALEGAPARPQKNGWTGGDPRHMSFGDGKFAKVLLSFETYGPMAQINVRLTCYGEDGNPIWLNDVQLDPGFAGFLKESPALQAAVGKDPNYELSEESRQWVALQDYSYESGATADAAWIKMISDPVSRDPLSFLPSECLLAFAKLQDKNLVANITDNLISPPEGLIQKPKMNLLGYVNSIKARGHYEVDEDDGWIQIKPDGLMGPPQFPQDRVALKQFLTACMGTGYITIDALADYAKSLTDDWNAAAFYSLRVLLPRSERLIQDVNISAYRFYGELSPSQRRSIMEGGQISVAALTPAAKEALYQVCCANGGYGGPADGMYMDDEEITHLLLKPLATEPTQIFAAGLPAGSIQATKTLDDLLLVGTQNTKYVAWTRTTTPEGYARDSKQPDSVFTPNDQFWVGKLFTLGLEIGLGPRLSLRLDFTEHRFDLRKKPSQRQDLPADIRKRMTG